MIKDQLSTAIKQGEFVSGLNLGKVNYEDQDFSELQATIEQKDKEIKELKK